MKSALAVVDPDRCTTSEAEEPSATETVVLLKLIVSVVSVIVTVASAPVAQPSDAVALSVTLNVSLLSSTPSRAVATLMTVDLLPAAIVADVPLTAV